MSTLNVTNISDGTDTTATANVVNGSAKAWVNFDGSTNTGGNCDIRASYNVSTVGDNGTGDYTVNFETAMPDTNYSNVGAATYSTTFGGAVFFDNTYPPTTSNVRFRVTATSNYAAVDATKIFVIVHR